MWELMKCSVQTVSPPGIVRAALLEFNPLLCSCLGSPALCLLKSSPRKTTGAAERTKALLIIKTGQNGARLSGCGFFLLRLIQKSKANDYTNSVGRYVFLIGKFQLKLKTAIRNCFIFHIQATLRPLQFACLGISVVRKKKTS